MARGLDEHVRFLVCPHCGDRLASVGRALHCGRGHAFDIARQGYVNLLTGRGSRVSGDTAEMVAARAAFLGEGHFGPIAEAVTAAGVRELARQPLARCAVDLGAGTGYYLDHLASRLHESYGLVAVDVSKHAMRRAATLYPRLAPVVADIRQTVPVASGSAGLVLDAFAPREPGEIDRILAADGSVVAVVPHMGHLRELVDQLGLLTVDPAKRERMDTKLGPVLYPVAEREVSYTMVLRHNDIRDLVRMGPSARHQQSADTDARLRQSPDPFPVSVSVRVVTYRRA